MKNEKKEKKNWTLEMKGIAMMKDGDVVAHFFNMTLEDAYAAARGDGHSVLSHRIFDEKFELRIMGDEEEAQALADWQADAEEAEDAAERMAEMAELQERGGE
jgi:hypothetical protein